jgi:hypothetical protein
MLRTLALLLILGLHSTAGAAEGLFHLCHGRLQFDLTCCCDHAKAEQAPPDARVSGEHHACCDELKLQRAPTQSATAVSGHAWMPLPVAVVPRMAFVLPPAAEAASPAWVRIRGVHRSTAPPLYIQHCSYLK